MKKAFLLCSLLVLFQLFVFAAAPTASSSNLTFNSIDGTSFSGAFTAGNGTERLVVIKEGSPVTGLPVNGRQYAVGSIGTAGAAFTAPGEYVIQRSSWSSFHAANLKPGTVYYFAIFEFNGSGAATEYLMLPLTGSRMTAVAPTAQAVFNTAFSATGNTLGMGWTAGNGTGRIVLARKAGPVNAVPTDLVHSFAEPAFETGTRVGADNYVVYRGAGTGVQVKNLEPATTYHFAVFEYNGINSPVHLVPGSTASFTTAAGPSVASSSVSVGSVEGNRMTLGWSPGNGARRLVVARKTSPVTAVPVNDRSYNPGSFGTGTEIAPDEFVVGDLAGTSLLVTGLEAGTTYHFRIFDYDMDKAGKIYYLTSSFASKSGTTAAPPSVPTSNLRLLSNTGTTATISFTPGNGTYRVLVMKEGGAVDATPQNFSTYSGTSNFGAGTHLGNGNYASHWGTNGATITVNSLLPGKTYHAMIFEFNGYGYPVYTVGTPISFTLPVQPTQPATNLTAGYSEAGQMRVTWTSGNGTKRIVLARRGSNVTTAPTDGVSYTANAAFGQGQELAPGEFVVFNGTANYVDVTNLVVTTTYHYAVFEYNLNGDGQPDYLPAHPAASGTTAGYPTNQLTLTAASAIQSTSATLNFSKGSGENRVFFMSENDMQTFLPADYVKYANNTYGTSASHVGGGVYCVTNTSGNGSFGVTNLKPNTRYYVRGFEYNGVNSPAYLRTPVPAISFITADVPGATVPTVAATNGERLNEDGNKLTLQWAPGNGEKRIVVMRRAAAVSFVPSSATAYAANASFGAGADLGGGQYVVYNGNGSSVEVTGLLPSETYFATVYEYNGAGDMLRYLTSSKLNIAASTVFAPATPVSNAVASIHNGRLTLTWTPGDGAGRLVVVKEGSAVTAAPADLSIYPANAHFANGSQMAAGEYVVYAGAGSTVTISGLQNKIYYYRIYEYNGSAGPVYNLSAPVSGSAAVSSPLPVQFGGFSAGESVNGVLLQWVTLQEVNSDRFVVERSTDGLAFTSIGTVSAAGNSSEEKSYRFTDHAPGAGLVYYRIRQVDRDGKILYSTVQLVSRQNSDSRTSVYPNPFANNLKLQLPREVAAARVRLYNAGGNLVLSRLVKNGESIDGGGLRPGTYLLIIEHSGKQEGLKIVKQ